MPEEEFRSRARRAPSWARRAPSWARRAPSWARQAPSWAWRAGHLTHSCLRDFQPCPLWTEGSWRERRGSVFSGRSLPLSPCSWKGGLWVYRVWPAGGLPSRVGRAWVCGRCRAWCLRLGTRRPGTETEPAILVRADGVSMLGWRPVGARYVREFTRPGPHHHSPTSQPSWAAEAPGRLWGRESPASG